MFLTVDLTACHLHLTFICDPSLPALTWICSTNLLLYSWYIILALWPVWPAVLVYPHVSSQPMWSTDGFDNNYLNPLAYQIMGDCIYPNIDWSKSTAMSVNGNKFINQLQDNFMLQVATINVILSVFPLIPSWLCAKIFFFEELNGAKAKTKPKTFFKYCILTLKRCRSRVWLN